MGYTPTKMQQPAVDDVLAFLETFVGAPYRWHKEGDPIGAGAPFWAENAPPPTREQIDREGAAITCTGLANLARRFVGRPVPGVEEGDPWPGTTGTWFSALEARGVLEPIDAGKAVPAGTLLLRNFGSVEGDQGHVAVVASAAGRLLDATLLHAYATAPYGGGDAGATGYTPFEADYYSHVCYPQYWLFDETK